eukprot:g2007.t1
MGIPPAAMSELGGLTVACRDFGPVPTQRRAPALFQRKAPLRGPKQSGLGWAVMAGAGSAAAKEAQRLLEGRWQLLSTFTPGQAAANLFSLKSWQETFSRQGLECDWWVLDLSVSPKRWYNVIDATPAGIICLEADLTSQDADVRFQWTGGQIIVKRPPWSQEDLPKPIRLPYPVPFALLGDRARGIFETAYLDEDLRHSIGDQTRRPRLKA